MVDYLEMQKDGISENAKYLFLFNKSLEKWNCNKRIDYLHLTGNIKRSIGNHYWSPEDKGIMRLWN